MSSANSLPGSAGGWTNSTNALSDNGAYAEAGYSATNSEGIPELFPTPDLALGSFTLSGLGGGDTVRGFILEVESRRVGGFAGTLYAQLTKSGTPVGSPKAVATLSTSDTVYSVGSSTDMWGASFTAAEVANVGVILWVIPAGSSGSSTAYVDYARVTVHFDDTTPDAFDWGTITNQPLNTMIEAFAYTITGLTGTAPVSFYASVGSSEWRKNFGSWTSAPGTVVNGDQVQIRHNTGPLYSTIVTTALQIGGVNGSGTTITQGNDTTPDAFSFGSVGSVEPGSLNTSGGVVITGINTAAGVSITGGEYNKNGSGWISSPTTCNNGDLFYVRGTASGSFSTGTTVILTVGTGSGAYSITTRAADTTPNAFTWTDVSGVGISTVQTSNTITVAGIEAAATLSFSTSGTASAHEYRKNGGAWTALGTSSMSAGDTLQLRMTAPAVGGQSGSIVANIGGVADTFTVTSSTGDSTPDAFAFVDEPNAAPSAVVESNLITLAGLDTGTAVSFSSTGGSSHQYSKNGGAWTAIGATTAVNGDTFRVRLTSPSTITQTGVIVMTVGGVADTFTVTSTPIDTVPNAFSFSDISGADFNTVTASEPIVVTGINSPAAISIVAGEYNINGGAWTTVAGAVSKNDEVRARVTSASQYAVTVGATVTIGGMSDTFSVTTRSPDAAAQFVVTFREAVYGADY